MCPSSWAVCQWTRGSRQLLPSPAQSKSIWNQGLWILALQLLWQSTSSFCLHKSQRDSPIASGSRFPIRCPPSDNFLSINTTLSRQIGFLMHCSDSVLPLLKSMQCLCRENLNNLVRLSAALPALPSHTPRQLHHEPQGPAKRRARE